MLARKLSVVHGIALGIGATIGGTMYTTLGLAASGEGGSVLISLALLLAAAMIVARNYAWLSTRFPSSSTSYRYVSEALGPRGQLPAELAGLTMVFGYTVAAAFYAMAFSTYAKLLLGFNGLPLAALVLASFALINASGVAGLGRAELALSIAKTLLITAFIAPSLMLVEWKPLRITTDPGPILYASSLLFVGFEGFDVIASSAEEFRNPRDMGKAIYASLLISALLYSAIALIVLETGAGGYTAVEEASEALLGPWARLLVTGSALVSTSSAMIAALYGASRILYGMAQEDAVNQFFATTNSRRSPVASAAFVTAAALALLAAGNALELLASAASLGFLMNFALVSLAAYRLSGETWGRVWGLLGGFSMALLAAFTPPYSWLLLGAWLAVMTLSRVLHRARSRGGRGTLQPP